VVAWNPDQLRETLRPTAEAPLQVLDRLSHVPGHDQPVVGMVSDSIQSLSIGWISQVQVADSVKLHSSSVTDRQNSALCQKKASGFRPQASGPDPESRI
jgi:hypothetical protein